MPFRIVIAPRREKFAARGRRQVDGQHLSRVHQLRPQRRVVGALAAHAAGNLSPAARDPASFPRFPWGKRGPGPIFRDRRSPASEDLSASVRTALAASTVLVVLCSPEARASRAGVAGNRLFREIAPDRPILAAARARASRPAFPPAPRRARALAADLRKRATDDGTTPPPPPSAFCKIVAGVAGVPCSTRWSSATPRRIAPRDRGHARRDGRRCAAADPVTTIALQSRGQRSGSEPRRRSWWSSC